MPALPDVPAVFRIDHIFKVGEDLVAKCRTFVQYSGTAPTGTQLNTLATAIGSNWSSHVAAYQSSNGELETINCTDLTTPTSAFGTAAPAVAGGNGHAFPTAAACTLEKFHIGRRYRGGHARIYWPLGTTNDQADAQTWGTTYVTNVTSALQAYAAANGASGWAGAGTLAQVQVSYYTGFTVHTGTTGRARNVATVRATPVVDQITTSSVSIGIASQRKRLLRLA